MSSRTEQPVMAFGSVAEWEEWLAEKHCSSDGVWIKFARKESGLDSVTHAEALEAALSYGWIDGQAKAFDGQRWVQRFTPRRRGSKWSKINCAKAEELIAHGKMQAAGLREVEAAKADGRWAAAYAGQRAATVPEDLQQALDANPAARAFFATLNSQNRYAILYR